MRGNNGLTIATNGHEIEILSSEFSHWQVGRNLFWVSAKRKGGSSHALVQYLSGTEATAQRGQVFWTNEQLMKQKRSPITSLLARYHLSDSDSVKARHRMDVRAGNTCELGLSPEKCISCDIAAGGARDICPSDLLPLSAQFRVGGSQQTWSWC